MHGELLLSSLLMKKLVILGFLYCFQTKREDHQHRMVTSVMLLGGNIPQVKVRRKHWRLASLQLVQVVEYIQWRRRWRLDIATRG